MNLEKEINTNKTKSKRCLGYAAVISFFVCLFVMAPISQISAQTEIEQSKAILENELKKLEDEIKKQEAELARQKSTTGSLSGELKKIQSEIDSKKSEIANKNKKIDSLAGEIASHSQKINKLEDELNREQESLKRIFQRTYQNSDANFVEYMLSGKSVTDIFSLNDVFSDLQRSLYKSAERIKLVRSETEQEKNSLEKAKTQEANNKYALEQDKKTIQRKETDQKSLVSASKNKEEAYAQYIKEQKARAAQIRNAIFSLAGGGDDTGQISFGEAYDYASVASAKSGVRTALILAILRQESGGRRDSFGHNVGQCYLKDTATGSGVKIKSGSFQDRIMKPTRDVQPFLRITKALNKDPFKTQVSCPFSYGYGGAMGISQFIPSTWAGYESSIKSLLGVSAANPWNAQHAIMGTALLMRDNGASAGGYTAERKAALRYYAGGNWSKPQNAFYGDGVMKHAADIQGQIDILLETQGL